VVTMRPRSVVRVVLFAAIVALAGGACSSPQGTPPPGPSAPVVTNSVVFLPKDLAIPAGTTVIWTNPTNIYHDVTSDDASFGGSLGQGNVVWHTFTKPGTYHYVCTVHDGMSGTVTVH